jgi:hypothetical protein
MNPATVNLIIALLPLTDRLIFDVGDKLIEINTKNLTDPVEIVKALDAAKAEGFPQLRFVSGIEKTTAEA